MKNKFKKTIILLVIFFLSNNLIAQTNKIIDKNASDLANEILKKINDKVPKKSKIAVLNFFYINNKFDTVRSQLGQVYAQKLMFYLQQENQKQGNKYKILIPNKLAQNKMDEFFVLPKGANEGEYWEKYLGTITPDFYITGEIKIDKAYNYFATSNVIINSDAYLKNKTKIAISNTKTKVTKQEDKLSLVNFNTVTSISELSDYIALQLKFKNKIENIELLNFTYQNTDIAGDFSYRLTNELEQKLVNKAGFKIKKNQTRGVFSKTDKSLYSLKGTYNEENDKLKIYAKLENTQTKQTISGVEAYLPLSFLKNNNIPFKPDNYRELVVREENIKEGKETNDFNINVWTNKGNQNLVFEKDEILKLYIKSDKVCYIRLIYLLADGSAVLLLNNFKINADKVGKQVKIPDEFYCAEPFGAETLILNAQTSQKFDPLNTNMQDGYEFINNNIKDIINNNRRGFKKKIYSAETKLNFVTVDKKY